VDGRDARDGNVAGKEIGTAAEDAPMTAPEPTEAEIDAVAAALFQQWTAEILGRLETWEQQKSFTKSSYRQMAKFAIAALASARSPAPEWRPTHRHYKGGLYRKIGEGIHTETVEPLTFYDNAKGELFARPTAMFNGSVDWNGYQLRFAPLPSPPKETSGG